jgi:hypothetical protein
MTTPASKAPAHFLHFPIALPSSFGVVNHVPSPSHGEVQHDPAAQPLPMNGSWEGRRGAQKKAMKAHSFPKSTDLHGLCLHAENGPFHRNLDRIRAKFLE